MRKVLQLEYFEGLFLRHSYRTRSISQAVTFLPGCNISTYLVILVRFFIFTSRSSIFQAIADLSDSSAFLFRGLLVRKSVKPDDFLHHFSSKDIAHLSRYNLKNRPSHPFPRECPNRIVGHSKLIEIVLMAKCTIALSSEDREERADIEVAATRSSIC